MDKKIREEIEKSIKDVKQQEENKRIKEEEERKKEEEDKKKKEDEERKKKEEEEKAKTKIDRLYFVYKDNEPKQRNIMSIEYMFEMGKLKICEKIDLLDDDCKKHLISMNTRCIDIPPQKGYNNNNFKNFKKSGNAQKPIAPPKLNVTKEEPSGFIKRTARIELTSNSNAEPVIKQWGRMDISEFVKEAEIAREKIQKAREEDPIRDEMMDQLNKLTVDTYTEVKNYLLNLIKDDVEIQKKFLSVLFEKALHGKSFVFLYADLCKDFNRELPQKEEKEKEGKVQSHSIFRKELLNKSKDIINNNPDYILNIKDSEERFQKLKKFVLGNINFITELILAKVLSKNISFVCISNFMSKIKPDIFENDRDFSEKMCAVYAESVIIIIDKFGTHINQFDKSIKQDVLKDFNNKIDAAIENLNEIVKTYSFLPSFLSYKIINIIEKKKNGWELTEVDKIQRAKGLKEVNDQMNNTSSITNNMNSEVNQEDVNSKVKADLTIFRDYMKEGGDPKNFDYKTTEELVKRRNVKLYHILEALKELSIDFINNSQICHLTALYFYEHVSFYCWNETSNECNAQKVIIIDVLNNLSDMMLDNMLLSDFWGQILFSVCENSIMHYKDIDKCTLEDEDQLQAVFEAIKYASESCKGKFKERILNEASELNYVKNNKELFDSVIQGK